ncbi:MAG: CobW family GTP-binding protein [Alphaproteobacteria bacterium]
MARPEPVPVSVITGFLGSGKTTLLSHLLKRSDMGRTAVIINEFGEVGLDHDLVSSATDDTILMESGCICCTIKGELVETMRDLLARRAKGEIPPFERLLIETTGLADPVPILHTLMGDPVVGSHYRLDGVVATVDAINGERTLDAHEESVRQVAMADRLLLTKTDLVADPASRRDMDALLVRLKALNPGAPVQEVRDGEADPRTLFEAGLWNPETKSPDVARWLREEAYHAAQHAHEHGHDHDHGHDDHHHHHHHKHDDAFRSFVLTCDRPLAWNVWVGWLEALVASRGGDLLRMKGILNVDGLDRPVAVHGVQHLFHPPVILDAWPSDDRRSRIIFITRNVGADALRAMLDAWAQPGASVQ